MATQPRRKKRKNPHRKQFPPFGRWKFLLDEGTADTCTEKCPETRAEKCAEEKNATSLRFQNKTIGRVFWRIFWRVFSPNRFDCLADAMEPLSASSKVTRAMNLRMPQGKPWTDHFAWNTCTSQPLQRVLPQCGWQCSGLIEVWAIWSCVWETNVRITVVDHEICLNLRNKPHCRW